MTSDERMYFRDELRAARAQMLGDAEGFQQALFCIERLGLRLHGKIGNMGSYGGELKSLADESPLATEIPTKHSRWHSDFAALYEDLRNARNDALHQGARARTLTTHAFQVALILEDALMSDMKLASQYMVRDVVCGQLWQPISFVRQQMLAYSYSYLPFLDDGQWKLVSEAGVAKFLGRDYSERRTRLAKSLGQALEDGLRRIPAPTAFPGERIGEVFERLESSPFVVVDREKPQRLVGILTAFDVL